MTTSRLNDEELLLWRHVRTGRREPTGHTVNTTSIIGMAQTLAPIATDQFILVFLKAIYSRRPDLRRGQSQFFKQIEALAANAAARQGPPL